MAAAGIGVEVAADEAELVHAALELLDRAVEAGARGLGQLADADEGVGVEVDDPLDQVVAGARPAVGSTASSPTWWSMAEARGEKMVMSAPRSRSIRS